MKLSKVSNRASEDPREVVMRILNHPFIQAFLLCESICYLAIHTDFEVLNALDSAISQWEIL